MTIPDQTKLIEMEVKRMRDNLNAALAKQYKREKLLAAKLRIEKALGGFSE